MLAGLQGGDMIIIAGRPSQGKTAFACNIIESVAIDQKKPTALFSLEMGKDQIVARMACSLSGVDSNRVRKRMLNASDFQAPRSRRTKSAKPTSTSTTASAAPRHPRQVARTDAPQRPRDDRGRLLATHGRAGREPRAGGQHHQPTQSCSRVAGRGRSVREIQQLGGNRAVLTLGTDPPSKG